MAPEELNKITLQAVPNTWAKQAYLQGWDFEGRTYKGTCEMFKCIEIAEQVYRGGNTSKDTNRQKPTVPVMAVNLREEKPTH